MKSLSAFFALGFAASLTGAAFAPGSAAGVKAGPPEAPKNVRASDGTYSDRIHITWDPVSSASEYHVWRGTRYDGTDRINIASVGEPAYPDPEPAPASIYYYWIKAKNAEGTSAWSVVDFGYRNLSAPGSLSASDGTYTNRVQVAWSAVEGAEAYEVYRNTSSNAASATLLGAPAGTQYSDASATPGRAFYYWVKARSELTGGLVCTGAVSKVDSGWRAMEAPQNLSPSQGTFANMIRVSWSGVLGATGYEVWRNTNAAVGLAYKVADTTLTNCDDEGAMPGIVFHYWARAKSTKGPGPFSAPASGYCVSHTNPVPAVPGGVTASDGTYTDRVRVEWTAVYAASSYEVWRNVLDFLDKAEWVADVVGTRFEDFATADRVFYYYWIRAKNSAGVSGYSDSDSGYRISGPGPRPPVAASNVVNDYDGDRASELTFYGASDGSWNAMSASNAVTLDGVAWGGAEMTPAPGDYDGDRVSDLAAYHEASGTWYVRTAGGAVLFWGLSWGAPGYVPVRGDYDGDGRADFALYNSDQGQWCILSANGSLIAWLASFGGPGLNAVPGDYDGDGLFDLAVFDPALDNWYAMALDGRMIVWGLNWGNPGCVPVPGDYDGDGAADLAVYNTLAGYWYIRSVYGAGIAWEVNWGGSLFRPVCGDFDADGYADLAVYGEIGGAGCWYIKSLDGNIIAWNLPFGVPGSTVVGLAE